MSPEERLRRAAKRYADAQEKRNQAIRDAAASGMTRRAIAALIDLSHQRVQQIIRGE